MRWIMTVRCNVPVMLANDALRAVAATVAPGGQLYGTVLPVA
jgi:hypothetical protein